MSQQNSITQTYIEILTQLSPSKQQHFLSRLYKITGDVHLLKGIQDKAFQEYYQKIKTFIQTQEVVINFNDRFNLNSPIPRQKIRNAYIHKNIHIFSDIFPYLDILMAFNVIHRYHQEHRIDSHDYSFIQEYLDKHFFTYFEEFLSSPDYLLHTPVQVINILYWYKHLPLAKLKGNEEERLKEFIQLSYKEPSFDDEIIYLNYLYTLTHIIIGASWFYEYKISQQSYQWIFEFFLNNRERIFATEEPDIIAEIGVCFCLQTDRNTLEINQYQQKVKKYFIPSVGYIPSNTYEPGSIEDINLSEHRNILAVMLFSGMNDLYDFPRELVKM